MKNKKRNILIIAISVIILIIIGTIIYHALNDASRLTTTEKEWITTNTGTVQSIGIMNNVDVLGKNGQGVFYDFIEDIKNEYNLTINPVTYNIGEEPVNKAFKIKTDIDNNDIVFYEGHYVLIGKTFANINSLKDLSNIKIGILNNDKSRFDEYSQNTLQLTPYENIEELTKAFTDGTDISLIILPLQQYLDIILKNNYEIIYHFSDVINYYVYDMPEDYDPFSSIIYKYFINWQNKLQESIANNTMQVFTENLNITQKELSSMQAKVYEYGFINNSPYEIITGGNYGGIVGEYLRQFSEVSNIEFKFRKYNSVTDFSKAIENNDIDLYFDYYNLNYDYQEAKTAINLKFYIVAPNSDDIAIKSLKSLEGQTVYALSNSKLANYLKQSVKLDLKTYDNESELKKIARKGKLIAIDTQNYEYYHTNSLEDYSIRYTESSNINYGFKINDNQAFIKLFTKFINTLDSDKIITAGLYNHEITLAKGSTLGNIAKYTLLVFAALTFLGVMLYRSSKRIKIATKIKKDYKIRYIDQLTSLKNRNYLTENIANWNKNTIYPQAAIIVDLNNLQEINDTLGYEHGDTQIKAAANILIKTQIDNSDIIRTDGNEFLIYLVGYQEKQIVNYIRKLYKEFKNLPYEHGAAIGYSMITDDIKTIEDAMNEAVEDMRTKKEEIIEG